MTFLIILSITDLYSVLYSRQDGFNVRMVIETKIMLLLLTGSECTLYAAVVVVVLR